MSFLVSFRPIFLVVGLLLTMQGIAMLLPVAVDVAADNDDWQVFAASSGVSIMIGYGMYAGARGSVGMLTIRRAFILTTLVWLLLCAFGGLPYLWSGIVPNFTDAFFESVSGLTTTGSTVITGLDDAPPGILMWRGIQQWLGGLGIIVMAVAVLPMLQVGGMQLFKVEAFDTAEKIMPRATQISGSLTIVFMVITVLCAVAYMAAGMGIFDAVVHAMTTVATGGFSTKDGSLGHFDSHLIDGIAASFMILGGIPFLLYVQAVRGNAKPLFTSSQVHVFLAAILLFTLLAWALHPEPENPRVGFFHAFLNVTSLITGTGYTTTDYSAWGPAANVLFFFIMFIGGCAGSTSCGIKIFRFQILFEVVKQQIRRIFYPHGIFPLRFNGKMLEDDVASAVLNFFVIYLLLFIGVSVILNLLGMPFLDALSASGTAISNVGPALGAEIGPTGTFQNIPDAAKWVMAITMIIGRLEIFTVLVLFLPRFWLD